MVTTDDFYKTLPEKIRQEKLSGQKIQKKRQTQVVKKRTDDIFSEKNQKIAFELIIDPVAKTQTITVNMRKLKFFMRPAVFNEISEFTILCLKKLDLKKLREKEAAMIDEEDEDPMNDSFVNPVVGTAEDTGTTLLINCKLEESILVLERKEF